MNDYIANILGQPDALKSLLVGLDIGPIQRLAARVRGGEFDRIILTGMGASLYAAYPAWRILAGAGLPAWWLDSSELLVSARALITPRSLLWVVSQAGRSPELLALLDEIAGPRPRTIVATTNNLAGPLAQRADLVMPLHTAEEHGVATRTYVNTLAATQLAALAMTGQDVAAALSALATTAQALAAYLGDWERTVDSMIALLPDPDRLLLVGWGASLAAALDGALVLKEAARANAEGMSAGLFRHGPLELADVRLTVMVLPGDAQTADQDRQMAHVVAECGARLLWVSPAVDPALPTLLRPAADGVGRPIAEIVPIQLLSLHLAHAGGFEAAAFRHLGKMTWPPPAAGSPPTPIPTP